MGYQESLISVDCLAEVAGIDSAIRGSEEVKTLEYLNCYCATRARCDMYWGGWLGGPLSSVSETEQPITKASSLFAVVGGARLYQPFLWIDCIAGMGSGLSLIHIFHSEHRQTATAREFHPWPMNMINPADAQKYGIAHGQWIWIENMHGRYSHVACITHKVREGIVHSEHAWWFPEDEAAEQVLFRVFDSHPNK